MAVVLAVMQRQMVILLRGHVSAETGSFGVLKANGRFVIAMSLGSIAGTVIGGFLLGVVPDALC